MVYVIFSLTCTYGAGCEVWGVVVSGEVLTFYCSRTRAMRPNILQVQQPLFASIVSHTLDDVGCPQVIHENSICGRTPLNGRRMCLG
jgi:hypothetical protein